MKKITLTLLLALCFTIIKAQENSTESPLKFSGYVETYYIYDFANPDDHTRPDFLYAFNRHNEISLNIGFIQADYDNGKVRGKLALMTGSYANANLAAEPGVLKNIFEANAGVKISKNKNLWVDAGVFASHIGFGSAIGASCWTMTRSLLAEGSPYYLSGAKISYTSDNEKWFLSGLIVNGWQRIQRVEGNQTPAFGHQVTWTPNEKVTINSSSFVGSDSPDSNRMMRYFHNFYGQFQLTEKVGILAGFDIGAQQEEKGSSDYDVWYSPVVITRFALSDKVALALRVEYYADEDEVIVSTGTPSGFQTFGYSANLDITISENVLWRMEARAFNSRRDNIFLDSDQNLTNGNQFVGTSLCLSF